MKRYQIGRPAQRALAESLSLDSHRRLRALIGYTTRVTYSREQHKLLLSVPQIYAEEHMPHGPSTLHRPKFLTWYRKAFLQGRVEIQALQDITTPPLPATPSRQVSHAPSLTVVERPLVRCRANPVHPGLAALPYPKP